MECFAFGGATVRFASLETSFHAANHTIPPPPSYEDLPLCPKDKNRSPLHGEKPLKIVIYRLKAICQYSKRHSVGTCLWHVSMQTSNVSAHWKHAKGESTEKVQFFKDQNEKCLRFITFLSTNRLNKAMIGRKRRVKRLFLRY